MFVALRALVDGCSAVVDMEVDVDDTRSVVSEPIPEGGLEVRNEVDDVVPVAGVPEVDSAVSPTSDGRAVVVDPLEVPNELLQKGRDAVAVSSPLSRGGSAAGCLDVPKGVVDVSPRRSPPVSSTIVIAPFVPRRRVLDPMREREEKRRKLEKGLARASNRNEFVEYGSSWSLGPGVSGRRIEASSNTHPNRNQEGGLSFDESSSTYTRLSSRGGVDRSESMRGGLESENMIALRRREKRRRSKRAWRRRKALLVGRGERGSAHGEMPASRNRAYSRHEARGGGRSEVSRGDTEFRGRSQALMAQSGVIRGLGPRPPVPSVVEYPSMPFPGYGSGSVTRGSLTPSLSVDDDEWFGPRRSHSTDGMEGPSDMSTGPSGSEFVGGDAMPFVFDDSDYSGQLGRLSAYDYSPYSHWGEWTPPFRGDVAEYVPDYPKDRATHLMEFGPEGLLSSSVSSGMGSLGPLDVRVGRDGEYVAAQFPPFPSEERAGGLGTRREGKLSSREWDGVSDEVESNLGEGSECSSLDGSKDITQLVSELYGQGPCRRAVPKYDLYRPWRNEVQRLHGYRTPLRPARDDDDDLSESSFTASLVSERFPSPISRRGDDDCYVVERSTDVKDCGLLSTSLESGTRVGKRSRSRVAPLKPSKGSKKSQGGSKQGKRGGKGNVGQSGRSTATPNSSEIPSDRKELGKKNGRRTGVSKVEGRFLSEKKLKGDQVVKRTRVGRVLSKDRKVAKCSTVDVGKCKGGKLSASPRKKSVYSGESKSASEKKLPKGRKGGAKYKASCTPVTRKPMSYPSLQEYSRPTTAMVRAMLATMRPTSSDKIRSRKVDLYVLVLDDLETYWSEFSPEYSPDRVRSLVNDYLLPQLRRRFKVEFHLTDEDVVLVCEINRLRFLHFW